MTDREALKAKLRALLAKTVANGCTEAEAASAMAAAARIMEAHGLDADDVERIDGAPHVSSRARASWPYSFVWSSISVVSNCQTHLRWVRPAGKADRYSEAYVGRPHDVALAEYLRALCDRAIRVAQGEFRRSKAWRLKRSRKARDLEMAAFTEGLCIQLAGQVRRTFSHRVIPPKPADVKYPNEPEPEPTEAEKRRAEQAYRRWKKMINRKGYAAGLAAGGGITLSDAVNSEDADAPALIGRG